MYCGIIFGFGVGNSEFSLFKILLFNYLSIIHLKIVIIIDNG